MILVSGFNVYPNEIEVAIGEHPFVHEVGVIGVPSDKSGEVVMAVIVKRNPALTEEDIRQHCGRLLTGYKRPKQILFVDELPKNNVGKILRRELRARYASSGQTEIKSRKPGSRRTSAAVVMVLASQLITIQTWYLPQCIAA